MLSDRSDQASARAPVGGRQATEHLLACGARRIAFFGDGSLAEIGLRHQGYQAALQAAGHTPDPALYRPVAFVESVVRQEIGRMLADGVDFDAVFAGSDLIALAVIAELRALGRQVPQDVQVVGFDDIRLAAESHPALTTVRQTIDLAGRLLVQRLMDKLAGRRVEAVVMPTELVVRQTTRPC